MKRAFTLVEILIVLAIIMIIAAIIIPAFGRVREKGRQASCANNLRQIALSTQQYSADNNGKYPFWYNEFAVGAGNILPNDKPGIGWAVRIGDYVKSNSIFHCPTDSTPASNDPDSSLVVGQPAFTSYGYNLGLSNELEAKFTMPTRTVTFADDSPSPAWGIIHLQDGSNSDTILHSGSRNYAFVDGHVKWLPFGSILPSGRNSDVWPQCKDTSTPATACEY